MKEALSDKIRIEHVLAAILEIQSYIGKNTYQDYLSNSMLKSACLHQLSIIGDAFSNISKSLKDTYPTVDWKGFIGLRVRIVHIYFGIDDEIVWDIIQKELPTLYTDLKKIYNELLL